MRVFHGFKAAWVACQRKGLSILGVAGDTQLASYLVDPTKLIPHQLEQVAKWYLQRTVRPRKGVTGSGKSEKALGDVDTEVLGLYACHLVDTIGQLWPVLDAHLEEEGQRGHLYDVELPRKDVVFTVFYICSGSQGG